MTPPRKRPPFVADERTQLLGWYDLQRSIVHMKCEGLSEEDARRVVLPTSPLMTVAGILTHLRWTEHMWFEVAFLGGPTASNPQFDQENQDAAWLTLGATLPTLLAEYDRQCTRSNEIIAAHSFDDTGRQTAFPSGEASLRWMVIHMLEETARHVGHLDAVRELLDGAKGYY